MPRRVYNVRIRTSASQGAYFPAKIYSEDVQTLADTGAEESCINPALYLDLGKPPLGPCKATFLGADDSDLEAVGTCTLPLVIGGRTYRHEFTLCQRLRRSIICGQDFLQKHQLLVGAGIKTPNGYQMSMYRLEDGQLRTICNVRKQISQELRLFEDLTVPPRSAITTLTSLPFEDFPRRTHWLTVRESSVPNDLSIQDILIEIPSSYPQRDLLIPLAIINHSDKHIKMVKGQVMATMERETGKVNQESEVDAGPRVVNTVEKSTPVDPGGEEKTFLTSPADVQKHARVTVPKVEVDPKTQKRFADLCDEFTDIFSESSADLGEVELIQMTIETGDSPPIAQRPYPLALKHADWVKKELLTLEKAGVIVKSISPWASPIVVVPKKAIAPNEPPRRRMCVDYRALNALLPDVKKVGSSAKGVLTFIPLPKIDEMYGDLIGTTVYSNLDIRSGYYHIGLTKESQPKTAFVTMGGKWEFVRVPFGLSQAPAYFQFLVNTVLEGLSFAKGYLDDILIFSKDLDEHIDHIRAVFLRLRQFKLKLKLEKCDFFKSQVFYLGHLLKGSGIQPMPDKIEALKAMPPPKTVKEVQAFMGTTGYYRKFVPRFSDIARPIVALTRADTPFEWTPECQKSFELLKEYLIKAPILRFPDPNLPYVLFTDASKEAWGAVLTQPHQMEDGKEILHPIHYVSGLFKGSQRNWPALTKEAFAIYAAVRKLSFYLVEADITLRTDHKPLRKFLMKETMNNIVNNWAIELQQYNIKLEFIEGRKNTLADTLSRLVEYQPELVQEPEEFGYEFGYNIFTPNEENTPATCGKQVTVITRAQAKRQQQQTADPKAPNQPDNPPVPATNQKQDSTTTNPKVVVTPPLDSVDAEVPTLDDKTPDINLEYDKDAFITAQQQDGFCTNIFKELAKGQKKDYPYFLQDNILMKRTRIGLFDHDVVVVPSPWVARCISLAHEPAHNGINRTYEALRRKFFWPNMKARTTNYITNCIVCAQVNKQAYMLPEVHSTVPRMPMDFICMDLIGGFPPTSKGNVYALTAIDMLTSHVWAIPLQDKTAESVLDAFFIHIYPWGMPRKILTDNGTEFVNHLFEEVSHQLGVEHKITTPAYHPQSNGKLEGFHYFLKTCTTKMITGDLEWDEVLHLACNGYNFFPSESAKEAPFFLMFGRDPRMRLTEFLKPRFRYLGDSTGMKKLDVLHAIYWLAVQNISRYRQARDKPSNKPTVPPFAIGDLVFVKDHVAKSFDLRYHDPLRVIRVFPTQLELVNQKGQTKKVHTSHCKRLPTREAILNAAPDLSKHGRLKRYYIDPTALPYPPNMQISVISTLPFRKPF